MSTSKLQDCIDSAGRLATFMNLLGHDCTLEDVLLWCAEANVALAKDTKLASEAYLTVKEFDQ